MILTLFVSCGSEEGASAGTESDTESAIVTESDTETTDTLEPSADWSALQSDLRISEK